jgi:hypothetical protein
VSRIKGETLFRSIVIAVGAGSAKDDSCMENMFVEELFIASTDMLNLIWSRWDGHGPVMGPQVQPSRKGKVKGCVSGCKGIDDGKLFNIGSSDVTENVSGGALDSIVSIESDIASIEAMQAMGGSGVQFSVVLMGGSEVELPVLL